MKKQLIAVIGAIAAAAVCAASNADAQAIYRCGNSYGQEACADAKLIEPGAAPSAAEVAAARDEVQRESKMADELHAARKKDEAAIRAPKEPTQKAAPHGRGTPAKLALFGKAKTKGSKKKSA